MGHGKEARLEQRAQTYGRLSIGELIALGLQKRFKIVFKGDHKHLVRDNPPGRVEIPHGPESKIPSAKTTKDIINKLLQ